MTEPAAGLYEALVTAGLKAQLDEIAGRLPSRQRALRAAEAPDRIAWHLAKQIELALNGLGEDDRLEVGLRVAHAVLGRLSELIDVDPAANLVEPATVLHAILRQRPDGTPAEVSEPLIPLLDTTLLTNARGEPSLWSQLRSEIDSSDSVDVVMAFIRRSGITPLLDALRRHCDGGRPLRVLTTTYTGGPGPRGAARPRRRRSHLL